jgi:MarR family transcriptional regulator, 2-MHQ and catechol-resistance regulon repressor
MKRFHVKLYEREEGMATHFRGTTAERRAADTYVKLMRAAASVGLRLERHLLGLGLTESQFGVLEILLHLGPRAPGELKAKLLTTGGNITLVLDNLEKRGLVERRRDPADRRRLTVHLTPEGRKVVERAFPAHLERIVEEMKTLAAAEQEALGRLCRRLGRRE